MMTPEPLPPWHVYPSLEPETQGAVEAYAELEWLPFWWSLESGERAAYLDRWVASEHWRDAIREWYDRAEFDVEEDARESAKWLRARGFRT